MGHFAQSVFSLWKLLTLASMTTFLCPSSSLSDHLFSVPFTLFFHLFHNYWFLTGIPFLNLLFLHTFSGNFTKSWIRGPHGHWWIPNLIYRAIHLPWKNKPIFCRHLHFRCPKHNIFSNFYFLLPLSLAFLLSLYILSYSITISHGTYYNLP